MEFPLKPIEFSTAGSPFHSRFFFSDNFQKDIILMNAFFFFLSHSKTIIFYYVISMGVLTAIAINII